MICLYFLDQSYKGSKWRIPKISNKINFSMSIFNVWYLFSNEKFNFHSFIEIDNLVKIEIIISITTNDKTKWIRKKKHFHYRFAVAHHKSSQHFEKFQLIHSHQERLFEIKKELFSHLDPLKFFFFHWKFSLSLLWKRGRFFSLIFDFGRRKKKSRPHMRKVFSSLIAISIDAVLCSWVVLWIENFAIYFSVVDVRGWKILRFYFNDKKI
jgi:hypothetical protein